MIYDILLEKLRDIPEDSGNEVDVDLPNRVMTLNEILEHAEGWEANLSEISMILTLSERIKERLCAVSGIPSMNGEMVMGL